MRQRDVGLESESHTFVDGHVHWHPEISLTCLLDTSWKNASDIVGDRLSECILLVADMRDTCSFDRIEQARGGRCDWSQEGALSREECLFVGKGGRIRLIFGQQVVTSERLEVLVFSPSANLLADNLSIFDTVTQAKAEGSMVILPWSFGKWWGHRGSIIRKVLENDEGVFVGDSGLRPALYADGGILASEKAGGRCTLPGTDILRLPGDHARLATYGIICSGDSEVEGLAGVVDALSASDYEVVGSRLNLMAALWKQIQLRTLN